MRYFIITVDTEGDNLWNWQPEAEITTQNAACIKRFQQACECYNMVPVYLTNYEMALSDVFVKAVKDKALSGLCEIGMHLHAWNSPPDFKLENRFSGNPYITEYPKDVIREKHIYLKNVIKDQFGISPVSYRAGRWATNNDLFGILEEIGFLVDCSITPQLSHTRLKGMSVSGGPDYRRAPIEPYLVGEALMEVPMTTRFERSFDGASIRTVARNLLKGRIVWLRPAVQTVNEMIALIKHVERDGVDNVEFMIHSSELLAGGSPYCKTDADIENYYKKIEKIFQYANKHGYQGISLKDYYYTHIDALLGRQ